MVYDPINNLIYCSGWSNGSNMNPLGEAFYPSDTDSEGHFFAAYNSQGILQFMHIFSVNDFDRGQNIGLDLMENRLLITGGRLYGYPDLDVTEDQFYPAQNYPFETSGYSFVSIYGIEGGLELNGQYFFPYDRKNGYLRDTYLIGNNLLSTGDSNFYQQQFSDYNHEPIVTFNTVSYTHLRAHET